MAKLTAGQTMPDFTYDTPFASGRTLTETVQRVEGKTALVFLRYYGCTLCQLDIRQFAQEQEKITAGGGQMLVVLQSDPALIAGQMQEGDLPFDIICDPDQKLYKDFEINPAKSKLGMVDFKTIGKMKQAKSAGLEHGKYEGDELQLPAVFVVDRERNITHAHYGKKVSDVPDAGTLAAWLA